LTDSASREDLKVEDQVYCQSDFILQLVFEKRKGSRFERAGGVSRHRRQMESENPRNWALFHATR